MPLHENVFLLLGSNLGDRFAVLTSARQMIEEKVGPLVKESSVYETAPWGITDQPAFLNQVIEIETELAPEEVLRNILDIEHELGRVRYERWGARVIDIDLLYFNDLILDSARLTLPHPRISERRFTLIPLAEIAPNFINPFLKKNSSEMLAACEDESEVSKIS
ncbi:2-amino-4-hydroxy-6-hydroxymethyldihydropteridine diphosphokinase [Dyadobacter luticola]|uniref:2-amino-4-hydroxy-6-hydroxymethyldihydropteridine pyrophosphokinase n=1 Tax=Dyadobacter luticola TaxID=1979387 RepID=A0A5R9KP75_9BACT|nr:2-amino-4-hydroxy-6-hydroxymethyldihydropteridine diphosphokinase [Dyadobacter luticola]TLU97990.1 2-amino-4-hydroxy-6-hydroxymethyldihydropteridine diphosphokinase [Dyadobacter luticola]